MVNLIDREALLKKVIDLVDVNKTYTFEQSAVLFQVTEIIREFPLYDEQDVDTEEETTEEVEFYFKGYDYSELAEFWGFDLSDDEIIEADKKEPFGSQQLLLKRIEDYVVNNYETDENIIPVIKEFLLALTRDETSHDDYSKVWKTMREMQSDLVFIQFFCLLLGHMWT